MAQSIAELRAKLGVAVAPAAGQAFPLDLRGNIPVRLATKITKDGVFVAQRHGLNFITSTGATVTVVDNPALDRVDVTVTVP